jgi:hypothetical protein
MVLLGCRSRAAFTARLNRVVVHDYRLLTTSTGLE